MTQFVAQNPHAKVLGASIMPIIEAMGGVALPVLTSHHLGNIAPNNWYPLQDLLDVFRELHDANYDFVAVGMRIPDDARFPPNINSIETALNSLNEAYHMNHQDEDGKWEVHVVAENEIVCISSTPYPSNMEYGIVYSLTRRFRPEGVKFTIYHEETVDGKPNRKNAGQACLYRVVWDSVI